MSADIIPYFFCLKIRKDVAKFVIFCSRGLNFDIFMICRVDFEIPADLHLHCIQTGYIISSMVRFMPDSMMALSIFGRQCHIIIGLDVCKPVFWVLEQQRRRLGLARLIEIQ